MAQVSEAKCKGSCCEAHKPKECPAWHLDVRDQRPEWGVWRSNPHQDEGGEG